MIIILSCLSALLLFSSCSKNNNITNNSSVNNGTDSIVSAATTGDMKDGQYRAEYREFDDHGWKDYVVVTVSGGKYTSVEFDSLNREDGRKKSEDKEYMNAYPKDGNFVKPDEYTKRLAQALVEKQDAEKIDTIATATTSSESFKKLVNALTINIKRGKTETVIVENQV